MFTLKPHHKQVAKDFSGALSANILSSLISVLTLLVVPKIIGLNDYSYWQLYIFYVSFVGFMHLGLADGVYLRYGGEKYKNLNKPLLSSQFWLLAIFEFIVFILFTIFALLFIDDANKILIISLAGFNCLLMNTRNLLQFILQSTDRILAFSKNLIIEKILYVALICAFLLLGHKEYEYLIAADIVAKTIMLLVLCYTCRDIVFSKMAAVAKGLEEAWENIGVGIKLMIANVAGMLIVGVVRFSIERVWDIETFGKVSLTLTAANLIMIFVSSASTVLFPIIKRTDGKKFLRIYTSLRTLLMVIVMGALLLYYPTHHFLTQWLPDYADSLIYMSLLFPICIYETKMTMLISTYLKALRKEKTILFINLGSVLLSIIASLLASFWLKDLTLAIFSIIIILAVRAIISEIILARLIGIDVKKDLVLEVLLTIIFISTSWLIGGLNGIILYGIAYITYLIIKKRDIAKIIKLVKQSNAKDKL